MDPLWVQVPIKHVKWLELFKRVAHMLSSMLAIYISEANAASPLACQAQMESLRKSHRDDLSRVQRVACHTGMMVSHGKETTEFLFRWQIFLW